MSLLLRYDPDGGDLGRGVKVTSLELAVVVPHIANILQALYDDRGLFFDNSKLPAYKYGFEVYLGDKNKLYLAISDLEKQLPKNIHWYECDGQKIFELRGASGGVTTALACYLVTDYR